ncbi:MAG: hypothetical protein D6791_06560 [Chloroflexi bacterium]|nr:MAG: hypothetical protein D6791_06560 [Chloroflexota bacterium]
MLHLQTGNAEAHRRSLFAHSQFRISMPAFQSGIPPISYPHSCMGHFTHMGQDQVWLLCSPFAEARGFRYLVKSLRMMLQF